MSPCTLLVLAALATLSSRAPGPPAPQDAPPAPASKPVILAIADFSGEDRDTGRYIADLLTTDLAVSPLLRLAERTALPQVLAELKLQSTGVGDPLRARKQGSVAGAEFLVTGSYVERKGRVRVTARVLDLQTGLVIPEGAFLATARSERLAYGLYPLARDIHGALTKTEIDKFHKPAGPRPVSAASLMPDGADPEAFVTERALDRLVERLREFALPETGVAVPALQPAGPLTNARALAAIVRALVPADNLARLSGARHPPPDIEEVPLWARTYVYTAQREGWWPAMQPVRAWQLARWGYLRSLLSRITLYPREGQDAGRGRR